MSKKAERDDKRRFELFFKYLNMNEQYKKCWEWWSKNYHEDKNDISKCIKKNPYHYEAFLHHWAIFGNPNSKEDVNARYQKYRNAPLAPARIFNLSQEADELKNLFKACEDMLPLELTVDNFILAIKETLCREDQLYIKIDIDSNYSRKEITAEVQNIVAKEREKRKFQEMRKRKSGLDELQRYLTVYDISETRINGKKIKWKSIHEQINPSRPYTEEKRLSLLSDHRKARLIIKKSIECFDPRDFPK